MKASHKKHIDALWKHAKEFYWGDPLDVRYYLGYRLSKLRNKKILDLGCNAGIIASCIDESNEYLGFDINEDALALARKINPKKTFENQDIFQIQKEQAGTFDIVIVSHVLPKDNYVSKKEPIELLQIAKKYLRANGKIVLTTPNPDRCYNRKQKIITTAYLRKILVETQLKANIQYWCKWPIQFNHILQYVPGIFSVLEKQSKKPGKSVAYYLEASNAD